MVNSQRLMQIKATNFSRIINVEIASGDTNPLTLRASGVSEPYNSWGRGGIMTQINLKIFSPPLRFKLER